MEAVQEKKSKHAGGVPAGTMMPRWTQKEVDLMIELQNDGWNNEEIAAYIGRSVPSVSSKLSRLHTRRSKELRSKIQKVSYKKRKQPSEMPVEPFCGPEQGEVQQPAQIGFMSLIQNNQKLEDILYDVIYRACFNAMRDALNE